jgi:hypothetical protein
MTHAYLSTACLHDQCAACRNTCKYCDAPCEHACHPRGADRPLSVPWVDQARGIALALFSVVSPLELPGELRERIAADPALFWLRGEAAPPGEWRHENAVEEAR